MIRLKTVINATSVCHIGDKTIQYARCYYMHVLAVKVSDQVLGLGPTLSS